MTNCDNCGLTFTSSGGLKYHIDNDVCAKKEYACKYCPKSFTTETSMYRHIRQYCKGEKDNDQSDDEDEDQDEDQDAEINDLKRAFNEMREEMKKEIMEELRKEMEEINSTNVQNQINHGTINNNTMNVTINNFPISAYGSENINSNDAKVIKVPKNKENATITMPQVIESRRKYAGRPGTKRKALPIKN